MYWGERITPPKNNASIRPVSKTAGKLPSETPRRPAAKKISIADVVPEVTCYECTVCGFIYDPLVGDPSGGIPPGENFLSLPADWVCPECSAGKSQFSQVLL